MRDLNNISISLQALNMLSFSRHVQLASVATPDASAALQAKLALHAARSLALPMGRGALTLSTVYLLPTEPMQAYKIVLDGALCTLALPAWHALFPLQCDACYPLSSQAMFSSLTGVIRSQRMF